MATCQHCNDRPATWGKFCSRSCCVAWQHKQGLRRAYVNDRWLSDKGKTYDAIYGPEKARELRERKSKLLKDVPYEERYGPERASELRQLLSDARTGDKHPLWGTHVPPEQARAHSLRMRGRGNPQFGKPAPVTSGYGKHGTFRGKLFRSTYELAYLVQADAEGWFDHVVPEPMRIPYTVVVAGEPRERTYVPDYLRADVGEVVEIKPVWKLVANYQNCLEKHEAARAFCAERGLRFRVVTEASLPALAAHRALLESPHVELFRP